MPEPMLDPERLVTLAHEATGLSDFGPDHSGRDTWREGLDRYVRALRDEARLHELGEQIAAGEIVDYLVDPPRARRVAQAAPGDRARSTSCRRS